MFRNAITFAGIMTLAASPLLADFSYQEKSTITGGALAGLMKVAGVFSKQAREPLQSTVSFKGDRMMTRSATHVTIVDLKAETITTVDLQKKTWYVMTFEQMKQMMEQMQESMKNAKQQNGDSTQMSFKVSANSTGNTKQVAGLDARELIMKLEMQGTDQQTGQTGGMVITSDMWLSPKVSGYDEVRAFHKRMAEKLNWSPGGSMFAQNPEVVRGMAEVAKEASKLDGMPVQQSVVMTVQGNGQQGQDSQTQQPQQQQQAQTPPPEKPSLGGALGGLMGVRRSKKNTNDPPPDSNKSSQPGSLLEMTTEYSGFSSAPVDDGMFAVPANFKQVEQPAMRRAK